MHDTVVTDFGNLHPHLYVDMASDVWDVLRGFPERSAESMHMLAPESASKLNDDGPMRH